MKLETKHKGIDLKVRFQEHDKKQKKLMIVFVLKGTKYSNGELVDLNATPEQIEKAHKKLVKWAKTVINENV